MRTAEGLPRRRRVRYTRGQVCPYCRDTLAGPEALSVCSGCSTLYHRECASELGGCGTLGCRQPRVERRVARRPEPEPASDHGTDHWVAVAGVTLLVLSQLVVVALLPTTPAWHSDGVAALMLLELGVVGVLGGLLTLVATVGLVGWLLWEALAHWRSRGELEALFAEGLSVKASPDATGHGLQPLPSRAPAEGRE